MKTDLMAAIRQLAEKLPQTKIMEVCGTHTMSIARSGIRQILPENIKLISGPGCPVCVSTSEQIDKAIKVSSYPNTKILTFGDMLKVPGSSGYSLGTARASGADVNVVYSPLDCLKYAAADSQKNFIFLGVGFETTAPTIAATIKYAHESKIKNLFFLNFLKVMPPPMEALLMDNETEIDAFICPGHVSAIIGANAYKQIVDKFGTPCVASGFEGTDILQTIKMLLHQLNKHYATAEIQYKRCVKPEGNPEALRLMYSIFDIEDTNWRGLGKIKNSGLAINKKYMSLNAENNFDLTIKTSNKKSRCICGEILKGKNSPGDCPLIYKACTPQSPVGPCMVSSEGACAAYFKYERFTVAA